MSDFGDMLREALVDEADFRPDARRDLIEEAVRGYETRMRTVRRFGLVLVAGPVVFFLAGIWVFLRPALGEDHRVLGVLLILFGMTGSGIGKLWFHLLVNHVTVMREIKSTQLAVATLFERGNASSKNTSEEPS